MNIVIWLTGVAKFKIQYNSTPQFTKIFIVIYHVYGHLYMILWAIEGK